MSSVVLLWSVSTVFALTMAACAALSWLIDRRNLASLSFCLAAVAAAAAAPAELGMMYAASPAAYGEWLRWYHVPIFFALLGQVLFVRHYLGTGSLWMMATAIALRAFVLVANFVVDPNFNFREIRTLDTVHFLGEPIAMLGDAVVRPWQVVASASMLAAIVFVFDAAARARRRGSIEGSRRAMLVVIGIALPMTCNIAVNLGVTLGAWSLPLSASLWFLGALTIVAYDLGRQFVENRRAQLQLAELRGQLGQIERVNSLGQLASALAHELKQPLSAALLNAEAAAGLAQSATPDLGEIRSIVADIRDDCRRAAAMIDRMRTLLRRGIVDRQPLALDDVVQDVLALAGPEATAKHVAVEYRSDPGLPPVLGDRVHISQVMLNLLINAIDAVNGRPDDVRRVLVEARAEAAGGVEVAVLDSGPGIPDDNIERVFSSLFTTKSGGMGIGLALSRTIIEAHGGHMWAENVATGGAAFRFTLPSA